MNDKFGYQKTSKVCHSIRACIDRVIQFAPDDAIFIESGAYFGNTSKHLVDKLRASGKQFSFYVIDNWKLANVTQRHNDNLAFFKENVGEDRLKDINIIAGDSLESIQHFEDNSVYFVFLDDEHEYSHVKKQIGLWLPKLIPDSIMAGDDYRSDGVARAVHEWFNQEDIELLYNNVGFLIQNPKSKTRIKI